MAPRNRRPRRSAQLATTSLTGIVAEAARDCVLVTRARALAAFVGDGRPVTTKAVLRRADIPTACAAAGRAVGAELDRRLAKLWA